MGGKGSGGGRVGAGRKPVPGSVRWQRRQHKLGRPATLPKPAANANVAKPADLPPGQSSIWDTLAPHALAAKTLTAGTAWAFQELCDLIVLKRATLSRISREGLIVDGAAHPLMSRHVALQVRVEAGLSRFKLLPIGREMVSDEVPGDEFAEFDQPLSIIRGGRV